MSGSATWRARDRGERAGRLSTTSTSLPARRASRSWSWRASPSSSVLRTWCCSDPPGWARLISRIERLSICGGEISATGGGSRGSPCLLTRQRRSYWPKRPVHYAGEKSIGPPLYWRIATRPAHPIRNSTRPVTRALDGVYCSSIEDISKLGQKTPHKPPPAAIPDISNSSARVTFVY
jgi:hypothetical protein